MEKVDRYIRRLLLSSSWIRHCLFWIVFFILNTYSILQYMRNSGAILAYVSFGLLNVLVFYSGYGLYLIAKRFNSLLLFVIGVLLGPPLLLSWVGVKWYLYLNPQIANLIGYFNFYELYIFLASMAAALKFGKDIYIWQQQEFQRKQEQAESELNFLKAQISPHFLFNTLNNLYGHAVTKSDVLPDMMLRLSDLLRYTIYETNKPLVPLHDELDYIKNYVALEKIRLSNNSNVSFSLPDNVDMGCQIAPLILISFVENAFKHSRHTVGQKLYIQGVITLNGNTLSMHIENSYNPDMKEVDLVKRDGGVGLENTLRRLQLLYADSYQLQKEEANGIYKLKLEITL